MWKVQFKHLSPTEVWTTTGSYGSEQSALSVACSIAGKHLMVRVVDPRGSVVWSA